MDAITDATYQLSDNYEHVDDNLEYILENVLGDATIDNSHDAENYDDYHKLKDLFNTLLINKCQCDETAQCTTCLHGGNYTFDKKSNELVLNTETKSGDLIYECTTMCKCKTARCLNRLVQYGPRKYLKVIDSTKYHSKGVITTNHVPRGAFICEYAGELLTRKQAEKLLKENELKNRMNYVLCLKEMEITDYLMGTSSNNPKIILTIVNPSTKGNIGRYLNHSCQPNCQIFSVRIDCPIPKIAIFSSRPIEAGEELSFNYNEGINCDNLNTLSVKEKLLPCLCGSQNCKKYLPNFEI